MQPLPCAMVVQVCAHCLPQLFGLVFAHCCAGAQLSVLLGLPALRSLSLVDADIGEGSLVHVGRCTKLTRLELQVRKERVHIAAFTLGPHICIRTGNASKRTTSQRQGGSQSTDARPKAVYCAALACTLL